MTNTNTTELRNGWVEDMSGNKVHYVNDKIHNDIGPAKIGFNGDQEYFHHDIPHRVGGPAKIWSNGFQAYYQYGEYHHVGAPAVIYSNGHQEYYQHDLIHREDGPARIWPDGRQEYWLFGVKVTRKHLAIMGLDDYPKEGFAKDQVTMFSLLCTE